MEEELLDWEVVHGSDAESTDSITAEKRSESSSVIDDGMILSDHFSTDNLVKLPGQTTDRSLESGDSSRVGYGSGSPNRSQNPVDVSVDLGLDQSGDAGVRNELGFHDSKIGTFGDGEVRVSDFEAADEKLEVVSESTCGTVPHYEDGHLLESDHLEVGDDGRKHVESQSGVEEPIQDSSKSLSDAEGNKMAYTDSGILNGEEEIVSGSEAVEESGGNTVDVVAVGSADESKSRETVWWKMPFVLVKYYAFRIGPVWSVSMAAALMGFLLLGRRLYNMKKKTQSFHLKVAIDDKVVSRVMNQAARLNEMFTEVRRVPVIRPALPSPGAWPVLSLR